MAFCHIEGFVHRDLKPKNIMVDAATDSIKIADLGLGRFVDRMNTVMNMSQKSIGGTPAYLCPEARVGADDEQREIGTKRDIYALGVIATEMVLQAGPAEGHAGRVPQLREAVEILQAQDTDTGALLVRLIGSCMEEDPRRRPHMTEIARCLASNETAAAERIAGAAQGQIQAAHGQAQVARAELAQVQAAATEAGQVAQATAGRVAQVAQAELGRARDNLRQEQSQVRAQIQARMQVQTELAQTQAAQGATAAAAQVAAQAAQATETRLRAQLAQSQRATAAAERRANAMTNAAAAGTVKAHQEAQRAAENAEGRLVAAKAEVAQTRRAAAEAEQLNNQLLEQVGGFDKQEAAPAGGAAAAERKFVRPSERAANREAGIDDRGSMGGMGGAGGERTRPNIFDNAAPDDDDDDYNPTKQFDLLEMQASNFAALAQAQRGQDEAARQRLVYDQAVKAERQQKAAEAERQRAAEVQRAAELQILMQEQERRRKTLEFQEKKVERAPARAKANPFGAARPVDRAPPLAAVAAPRGGGMGASGGWGGGGGADDEAEWLEQRRRAKEAVAGCGGADASTTPDFFSFGQPQKTPHPPPAAVVDIPDDPNKFADLKKKKTKKKKKKVEL
jgi:hypothetical protein